ncbi:hypothetical protein NLJ89_g5626 [Agrocybe chaxingu]|uniref:Holocytochrome c-type synthase n=1 Tax=Agrocybe chaxingu TaxID=84603 RepID=A0A9W8MVF2_9AGAR|nr:hypothetical protein NLJ89_g5626 [Agrocybe chaxingu]
MSAPSTSSPSSATTPVDHAIPPRSCPVDHSAAQSCPVDHTSQESQSTWSRFFSSSSSAHAAVTLSREREISSIPKGENEKWVYPSETQFFAAMARKNHNPQAADMKTIVPIHNAVNERAWSEILKWEEGKGGDACGGVKLVNFKGRPGDKSPKARLNMLLGYAAPFDRHDWVIERCGTRVRYVIDFYTGRNDDPSQENLSVYLDTRPALDNWEGVKMRLERLWK